MTHKDLVVWQEGMDFVVDIYHVTGNFPREEIYSLTNQIRRAAVSIPSNIAEGAARKNTKEFIQFLHIALGSMAELETQIIIAERLGYMTDSKQGTIVGTKLQGIRKMLVALIRSLTRDSEA